MEEKPAGGGLVWLVVGLMVVAGLAAFALVPSEDGPGGGGPNEAPRAAFIPANKAVYLGEPIEFNAADSSDPDGRITAFEWTFGDGEHAAGAIVEHEYTLVGAFVVTLTVTDDGGKQNTTASHAYVNDFITFAPGFVNWTTGQPPAERTVAMVTAYTGATALTVLLNVSTVQLAGAKINVSLLDPQDVEVEREGRTIAGNSFVTQVAFTVPEANLTAAGTWSVVLEVGPAQPGQFVVSVAYSGLATVRYDPA